MESIVHGNHVAIEPYSVLVEVVAAIRRRTGNRKVAQRIGFDLQNIATILFLEFLKPRALSAMDIANDIGLKGMDAIIVQIAHENHTTLLTLDKDMAQKASTIVTVGDVEAVW